ncbi:hypothetical protein [Paraburkholderia hayleyella]|uniref:hypothetical protein n=1 Tax=Paraburkholderia hayleyella TaxID=2152889 RepID=UPI0012915CDF|nr:hypothetical protein [Paraburkholderia hayleyella]
MIDLKEKAGVAMNARGPFSERGGDPEVTLGALAFANDLGRLLWRMKYGQDITRAGMRRTTLLLAERVRASGKFKRARFAGLNQSDRQKKGLGKDVDKKMADIVERFAERLIVEWVADVCPHCNGQRSHSLSALPRRVMATCSKCKGAGRICISEERIPFAHGMHGPMIFREWDRCDACHGQRSVLESVAVEKTNASQICRYCKGAGRLPVDDAARAVALGVSLDIYRRRWVDQFSAMLSMLDQIDGRVGDVMRAQLRFGTA